MPRARPKHAIGTSDLQRSAEERTLPEMQGGSVVNLDDIEVIKPERMMSVAQNEKFMNEKVIIQIEADEDPNSPVFIYTGHQGIQQYIKRGEAQSIKRKFLYSLIAAKRTQFACSFGMNTDKTEFNRLVGRTNTTYRLMVLQDTDEGKKAFIAWMKES